MVTFDQIKNNSVIKEYIRRADESLCAMGYTEHSFAHVGKVVAGVEYILRALGYDERNIELAKIAAYMHDIGNIVNREGHCQSGAIMAFSLLDKLGMDASEIATIITAIGNHDEGAGYPVDALSAALMLADKADVRRSRVRNDDVSTFDIHDRVNYSAEDSQLFFDDKKENITLDLTIDCRYSSVMEYFEIFLERMVFCKKAAERLGVKFCLVINGQKIL